MVVTLQDELATVLPTFQKRCQWHSTIRIWLKCLWVFICFVKTGVVYAILYLMVKINFTCIFRPVSKEKGLWEMSRWLCLDKWDKEGAWSWNYVYACTAKRYDILKVKNALLKSVHFITNTHLQSWSKLRKALPDAPIRQYFSDNHRLPLPAVSIIVLTL